MTKTHQLHIPAKATKDWVITRFDSEERRILKENLEEILEEANALAEDSLYCDDRAAVSQATLRLIEAVQSLVHEFV
jgi:hypothetical protein